MVILMEFRKFLWFKCSWFVFANLEALYGKAVTNLWAAMCLTATGSQQGWKMPLLRRFRWVWKFCLQLNQVSQIPRHNTTEASGVMSIQSSCCSQFPSPAWLIFTRLKWALHCSERWHPWSSTVSSMASVKAGDPMYSDAFGMMQSSR